MTSSDSHTLKWAEAPAQGRAARGVCAPLGGAEDACGTEQLDLNDQGDEGRERAEYEHGGHRDQVQR